MAISEAEKNANVSKILMEQKLMEKDSARRQQEIENPTHDETERNQQIKKEQTQFSWSLEH